LEGIEDVAAFGLEDELLGEAIAVSVTADAHRFSAEEIFRHCSLRLPPQKVPKYVFLESSLPRTESGKKQYFRLREKYRDAASRPLPLPAA
jgi:acyl-CoA synthetase (AMP-forming)/AMP-acid ligase II